MEILLQLLPITATLCAVIWGIYVFNKQQKFKRLENLNHIFQRFADKDDFIDIFTLCDIAYISTTNYHQDALDKLSAVTEKNKLRYLALLEEVALFAASFEVDKQHAIHLFQWHFYYVFNEPKISEAFWSNLGGRDEINKPYWGYQKKIANQCLPKI